MKVNEVTKKPIPAERNPVAAFAQRSGAGVHKDQNKKNKPLRKEKHKKKDFATESRIDETPAHAAAAVLWLIRWFGSRAMMPVLRWLTGKAIKWGLIAGSAAFTIDWVIDLIGEEVVAMLKEHGFTVAMIIALVVGAVALKRWVEKHGDKLEAKAESIKETYKQKAGDYARHGGSMPKKKKRGPHPLGGKLVG
jgi:hypothetical protein